MFQVPAFETARVLVVGDIMLDRYWYGDTGRISPEAPVPVVRIGNEERRLGGAANVALNLARAGVQLDGLLLTRSEEGMSLFADAGPLHLATRAQEVFDVTGAGDTVIALFAECAGNRRHPRCAGCRWRSSRTRICRRLLDHCNDRAYSGHGEEKRATGK